MRPAPAHEQNYLVRFNKAGTLDGEVNLELPDVEERKVEVGGCGTPASRAAAPPLLYTIVCQARPAPLGLPCTAGSAAAQPVACIVLLDGAVLALCELRAGV